MEQKRWTRHASLRRKLQSCGATTETILSQCSLNTFLLKVAHGLGPPKISVWLFRFKVQVLLVGTW